MTFKQGKYKLTQGFIVVKNGKALGFVSSNEYMNPNYSWVDIDSLDVIFYEDYVRSFVSKAEEVLTWGIPFRKELEGSRMLTAERISFINIKE